MSSSYEQRALRAMAHLAQLRSRQPAAEVMWRQRSNRLLVALLKKLMGELGIATFIECGAHEAAMSRRFVRSGSGRRAFAIEANPYTFERMTARAAKRGVVAICEGLGSEAGTARLWIPAPDETHTRPTAPHSSFMLMQERANQHYVTVDVPMTTLDLVAERFEIQGEVAIWMDVEGVALDVIRGGARVFAEQAALVFLEVESEPFWEGQPLVNDVEAELRAAGLAPIARDFERSYQYNAIYARRVTREMDEVIQAFEARLLRPVRPGHVVARRARRRLRKLRKRVIRAAVSSLRAVVLSLVGKERARRLRWLLRGDRDSG